MNTRNVCLCVMCVCGEWCDVMCVVCGVMCDVMCVVCGMMYVVGGVRLCPCVFLLFYLLSNEFN